MPDQWVGAARRGCAASAADIISSIVPPCASSPPLLAPSAGHHRLQRWAHRGAGGPADPGYGLISTSAASPAFSLSFLPPPPHFSALPLFPHRLPCSSNPPSIKSAHSPITALASAACSCTVLPACRPGMRGSASPAPPPNAAPACRSHSLLAGIQLPSLFIHACTHLLSSFRDSCKRNRQRRIFALMRRSSCAAPPRQQVIARCGSCSCCSSCSCTLANASACLPSNLLHSALVCRCAAAG